MNIIQHPAANVGGDIEPNLIVLHDTAGSLKKHSSRNYLASKEPGVSVHFVIERDGEISQLADTHRKTYHAGRSSYKGRRGVNDFSVGIEIVNPGKMERYGDSGTHSSTWFSKVFSNEEYGIVYRETDEHGKGMWMPYTEEQINSVEFICRRVMGSHSITDIVTHWMVSPGRKTDTNPLFPLDSLKARLFSREDPPSDINEYISALINTPASGLNFRLWPKVVSGNVIRVLPHHTAVRVVSTETIEGQGWSQVEHNGSQGYVMTSYLKTLVE